MGKHEAVAREFEAVLEELEDHIQYLETTIMVSRDVLVECDQFTNILYFANCIVRDGELLQQAKEEMDSISKLHKLFYG